MEKKYHTIKHNNTQSLVYVCHLHTRHITFTLNILTTHDIFTPSSQPHRLLNLVMVVDYSIIVLFRHQDDLSNRGSIL